MHFDNHEFYNCEVFLSDGTNYKINANWLHNEKLNYWKNWQCEAGFNRIFIDADSNVYSGQCLNDYLGNLQTHWELLNTPTTCKRERCTGCTDDILSEKQEI